VISLQDRAERIRGRDDGCFGCGSANPAGLHLHGFARDGEEIVARFDPRPEHRGFSGVLHGGVVAAALDEILAWTAMLTEGMYVVTGTLQVRYRAPAPATGAYRLAGRVAERRGRRLRLQGRLRLDGADVAEADGLFIARAPVGDDLGGGGDAG
jgi:acyl-coenzyme A thioesterase PaaI-like protein